MDSSKSGYDSIQQRDAELRDILNETANFLESFGVVEWPQKSAFKQHRLQLTALKSELGLAAWEL